MMMYAGAPRRDFQLPVAHEVKRNICARRLWLPLYGPCAVSEHVEMKISGHNTGIGLLLSCELKRNFDLFVWILHRLVQVAIPFS